VAGGWYSSFDCLRWGDDDASVDVVEKLVDNLFIRDFISETRKGGDEGGDNGREVGERVGREGGQGQLPREGGTSREILGSLRGEILWWRLGEASRDNRWGRVAQRLRTWQRFCCQSFFAQSECVDTARPFGILYIGELRLQWSRRASMPPW